MADSKISALPASTTPLAGTEVLPIVQSSATKQVSVANLTAGRAISATQLTLTTGNLIVASGQGIDFSATPGTGTSELLDDYETGTWTPSLGGDATYTDRQGFYTKIGNVVTCYGTLTVNVLGTGSNKLISGLPFTSATTAGFQSGYCSYFSDLASSAYFVSVAPDIDSAIAKITIQAALDGTMDASATIFQNGTRVDFGFTYRVA